MFFSNSEGVVWRLEGLFEFLPKYAVLRNFNFKGLTMDNSSNSYRSDNVSIRSVPTRLSGLVNFLVNEKGVDTEVQLFEADLTREQLADISTGNISGKLKEMILVCYEKILVYNNLKKERNVKVVTIKG